MHIFRNDPQDYFEPDGHYGNLQVSNIVTKDEGNFVTQFSHCPPGGGGYAHHHDDEDQLFVVIQGELTFETADDRFTLKAGEAVLFHAGEQHMTINESDEDSVSLVVTVGAK